MHIGGGGFFSQESNHDQLIFSHEGIQVDTIYPDRMNVRANANSLLMFIGSALNLITRWASAINELRTSIAGV